MSITHRIHGFIPRIHLAEVMLKNPEKKFIPGKKLKCKVTTAIVVEVCILRLRFSMFADAAHVTNVRIIIIIIIAFNN